MPFFPSKKFCKLTFSHFQCLHLSLHGRSRKCQDWELWGGFLVFCNCSSAGLPQGPLQHGCVLRERQRSPQGQRERENPLLAVFPFFLVLHHSGKSDPDSLVRSLSLDDSHVSFPRLCITTGRQLLGVTERLSTAMPNCSWPGGGGRV